VPRVYLLPHSNGDLRNSTVAGRLCLQHVRGFHGRLPQKFVTRSLPDEWKTLTSGNRFKVHTCKTVLLDNIQFYINHRFRQKEH
jgi:hypothetical protein